MKDCPKQTFVFIKFTYSSPSPHISLSLRQLDQCDEILDRSFDCRKHCHPHHSEACRDHWLGGNGNGPLIVCGIRDCHFVFHGDERRQRLHYVLRYSISMAMKLCYLHQVRLLALFILVWASPFTSTHV